MEYTTRVPDVGLIRVLTKAEIEKLVKEEDYGKLAEAAKQFIEEYARRTEERCKNEFANLEINSSQLVDKDKVFMLQLQIGMVRNLLRGVEQAMLEGKLANETLRGK